MLLKAHIPLFCHATRPILQNLHLSLARGDRILLCGPNGSGKTTLINILAGIFNLEEGGLTSKLEPGDIALWGHQNFLYPMLTVRENLMFWCDLAKTLSKKQNGPKVKDRVEETLSHLKLGDFASVKVQNLSHGTAKRLSLARICLTEPSLILLDEPEIGLDQDFTSLLISEILKQDACVIWASHIFKANHLASSRGTVESSTGSQEPKQLFTHTLRLHQHPTSSNALKKGFTGTLINVAAEPKSVHASGLNAQSPSSLAGRNAQAEDLC